MKQHIAVDQLDELSEKGREKWLQYSQSQWSTDSYFYDPEKKTEGLIIKKADADYDDFWFFIHRVEEYPTWHLEEIELNYKYSFERFLLLPSIGQMIEFLDEHHNMPEEGTYYIGRYPGLWTVKGQTKTDHAKICDALWEAVKEILSHS